MNWYRLLKLSQLQQPFTNWRGKHEMWGGPGQWGQYNVRKAKEPGGTLGNSITINVADYVPFIEGRNFLWWRRNPEFQVDWDRIDKQIEKEQGIAQLKARQPGESRWREPSIDISVPVLCIPHNKAPNGILPIDGWHRIGYASRQGIKQLSGVILDQERAQEIRIAKVTNSLQPLVH